MKTYIRFVESDCRGIVVYGLPPNLPPKYNFLQDAVSELPNKGPVAIGLFRLDDCLLLDCEFKGVYFAFRGGKCLIFEKGYKSGKKTYGKCKADYIIHAQKIDDVISAYLSTKTRDTPTSPA